MAIVSGLNFATERRRGANARKKRNLARAITKTALHGCWLARWLACGERVSIGYIIVVADIYS